MIPNNMRRAQAAASAGPTLTAVGWPAGFSVSGSSIETYPPLRIDGATSPQTLRVSVELPSINDSVDMYNIAIFPSLDTTVEAEYYNFESFNAATGQLTASPSVVWIYCDYTGSEMPPRTVTVALTHLERNAVVGSFTFTFNPVPE